MRYSTDVVRMDAPASIRSAQRARELIAAGEAVINLSVGQPDFPTPPEVLDAAARAMRDGHTGYTPSAGIAPLREAVAEHLSAKHQLAADPARIIVTPGAKAALFCIMRALLERGDRVVIPQPSWLSYGAMVQLAGGVAVPVASLPENEFLPGLDDLNEAAMGARAIILNNPVNPTGAIWPPALIEGVAEIAVRHNLLVISDEIYDDLLFDIEHLRSIASLDGMEERTVQVHGFSKTYAMTGFRLGYLRGSRSLVDQVQKVHEQTATCAPSVSQHAGIAALRLDQDRHLAEIRTLYRGRRDAVRDECRSAGLSFVDPGGAIYFFVGVGDQMTDSVRIAENLLKSSLVATVPGAAYGACSNGWIRLSLTEPADVLRRAIQHVAAGQNRSD